MFKNIVVPLDGSELAERAIGVASTLALKCDATIHAVRVVNIERVLAPTGSYELYAPYQIEDTQLLQGRGETYLQDLARARALSNDVIMPHVRFGEAAAEILAVADEVDADLIMMTTHGRSGIKRWALGSVTERVLHHATCPVLALRSQQPIDNILVTLDGSELAEQVIEPALEMARLFDASVMLLRVDDLAARIGHESTKSAEMLNNIEPGLGDIYLVDKVHEPQHYIEQVKLRYRDAGVPINAACVDGAAAAAIVDYAAIGNSLIAMSTHGRTGVSRWMYGSVTEKVLRSFDGALMIVRPA